MVPDGPLQSLPLGILVTEKPVSAVAKLDGYRGVPWLTKKYAITTLPSVSSLRALRRFAKASRAKKAFLGIGDPLLNGKQGQNRGVEMADLFSSRGVANVDVIRNRLMRLPETAEELTAIGKFLGVGPEALMLRGKATEKNVKTADLSDFRILAFATHALVAGELKGLAEPTLVLTPPATGSEIDDGLLTASEVAQLKLNADLVILSACNTASPDGTPGADALSGLTKAFFYAGSRALLVSHWPTFSDAAVSLTTGMVARMAKGVGRSEALRQSMLAVMNDNSNPHFAHPIFWAPFVVVGEGGRAS